MFDDSEEVPVEVCSAPGPQVGFGDGQRPPLPAADSAAAAVPRDDAQLAWANEPGASGEASVVPGDVVVSKGGAVLVPGDVVVSKGDVEAQRTFKQGRPDLRATLSAVAAAGGGGPSGVFACGPEAMLQQTTDAVAAANAAAGGEASRRFLLHVEVFHF